jgi:hypothetical protein
MQRDDDRTEAEQAGGLPVLVIGTDRFLSGWGKADGGPSYAAWATDAENMHTVERWVRSRRDMNRVRLATDKPGDRYRTPGGRGHLHIYAVRAGHPALGGRGCP